MRVYVIPSIATELRPAGTVALLKRNSPVLTFDNIQLSKTNERQGASRSPKTAAPCISTIDGSTGRHIRTEALSPRGLHQCKMRAVLFVVS